VSSFLVFKIKINKKIDSRQFLKKFITPEFLAQTRP